MKNSFLLQLAMCCLWSACGGWSLAAIGGNAAADEIRLGVASVKISPPTGTPMAGYYSQRASRGVLDDLYAKAAVWDDGKTRTAMIVCDLCHVPRPIVLEARRLIAEQTGVPAESVMIAATHTHTGPMVLGESSLYAKFAGDNPLTKNYTEQLPHRLAQAAADAYERRAPARVAFASETETRISFIRRYWMRDGSVRWNPGILNPDILRPIGDIDPQVNVVYAELPDKKPLLTFVNFALHLDTTGGAMISADFPAAQMR